MLYREQMIENFPYLIFSWRCSHLNWLMFVIWLKWQVVRNPVYETCWEHPLLVTFLPIDPLITDPSCHFNAVSQLTWVTTNKTNTSLCNRYTHIVCTTKVQYNMQCQTVLPQRTARPPVPQIHTLFSPNYLRSISRCMWVTHQKQNVTTVCMSSVTSHIMHLCLKVINT